MCNKKFFKNNLLDDVNILVLYNTKTKRYYQDENHTTKYAGVAKELSLEESINILNKLTKDWILITIKKKYVIVSHLTKENLEYEFKSCFFSDYKYYEVNEFDLRKVDDLCSEYKFTWRFVDDIMYIKTNFGEWFFKPFNEDGIVLRHKNNVTSNKIDLKSNYHKQKGKHFSNIYDCIYYINRHDNSKIKREVREQENFLNTKKEG